MAKSTGMQKAQMPGKKPRRDDKPISPLMREIAGRIAQARKRREQTQEGLAAAVDLSVSQISRFESAQRIPYVDELFDLARALKTPIADLLPDQGTVAAFPVYGLVGAGAIVEEPSDPTSWGAPESVALATNGGIGALLVRGQSQEPRFFDGEFVLYDRTPRQPKDLVDQYAIVQTLDGRKLIKTIRSGGGDDKWLLESHNARAEITGLLAAWRFLGVLAKPQAMETEKG